MTFGQIELECFEADFWPATAGNTLIDRLPWSMRPGQRDFGRLHQDDPQNDLGEVPQLYASSRICDYAAKFWNP